MELTTIGQRFDTQTVESCERNVSLKLMSHRSNHRGVSRCR